MSLDFNKIKGTIFDIDGTILDTMPIWQDAAGRYLRKLGTEPEDDLSDIVFPMTLKEGCDYIKEHYRLTESVEEIESGIIGVIENFYYYEAEAKPGAVELIEKFDALGIPMVLATTGDEELATAALSRLGLMDYFETLFVCGDYDTNKGETLIFDMATEKLEEIAGCSLSKDEIWVFEDSLKAITTTTGMGFKVAGIADSAGEDDWDTIEKLADVFYHSLEEALI